MRISQIIISPQENAADSASSGDMQMLQEARRTAVGVLMHVAMAHALPEDLAGPGPLEPSKQAQATQAARFHTYLVLASMHFSIIVVMFTIVIAIVSNFDHFFCCCCKICYHCSQYCCYMFYCCCYCDGPVSTQCNHLSATSYEGTRGSCSVPTSIEQPLHPQRVWQALQHTLPHHMQLQRPICHPMHWTSITTAPSPCARSTPPI